MPSRRPLLGPAVAAIAVVLVVGVWLLWPRPSAINAENATKIQVGMTLDEVEEILGGPARDDSTGPVVAEQWEADPTARDVERFVGDTPVTIVPGPGAGGRSVCWGSDRVVLWVDLDPGERVVTYRYRVVHRASGSPRDIVRRWLSL